MDGDQHWNPGHAFRPFWDPSESVPASQIRCSLKDSKPVTFASIVIELSISV